MKRMFLQLRLVVVLITVIGMFSCRKDSSIGASVLDDEHRFVNQSVDTFSILSYSEYSDHITTTDTTVSLRLLGSYTDPLFGVASSDLFFRLFLEKEQLDFSDLSLSSIDSVALSMEFRGSYGTSDHLALEVFELNEEITSVNYLSDNSIGYDPVPVGQELISVPNVGDSVRVGNNFEPAQVRISLNNAFGYNLLQKASNNTNISFINEFKGLAIIADSTKNQVSGTGNVLTVDMLSLFTSLTVFYQRNGSQESFSFRPAETSYYFNKFYHQYNNSVVAETLMDSTKGQDWYYIQSMAGINGRIKIPNLKKLITGDASLAIQKAELFLPVDLSEANSYGVHGGLIAREMVDGNWINIKDLFIEGAAHYGGLLNGSSYPINVTRYTQDLFSAWKNGEQAGFDLQIIPDGEGRWDARRSKMAGSNNGVKLVIYYTSI